MAENRNSSGKYRRVNPDDYYNYDEQFQERGGGGGGKGADLQGPKTLETKKKQQRRVVQDQRLEELVDALLFVLDGFPEFETETQEEQFLVQYLSWVESNLASIKPLDPAQTEVSFSKSGGPGGQNVNKRETKVSVLHKPTRIKVINDQTRSQSNNRQLAEELLQQRLEDHLRDWKMYLGSAQLIGIELIQELLEREM
jgi:hypothetical protein